MKRTREDLESEHATDPEALIDQSNSSVNTIPLDSENSLNSPMLADPIAETQNTDSFSDRDNTENPTFTLGTEQGVPDSSLSNDFTDTNTLTSIMPTYTNEDTTTLTSDSFTNAPSSQSETELEDNISQDPVANIPSFPQPEISAEESPNINNSPSPAAALTYLTENQKNSPTNSLSQTSDTKPLVEDSEPKINPNLISASSTNNRSDFMPSSPNTTEASQYLRPRETSSPINSTFFPGNDINNPSNSYSQVNETPYVRPLTNTSPSPSPSINPNFMTGGGLTSSYNQSYLQMSNSQNPYFVRPNAMNPNFMSNNSNYNYFNSVYSNQTSQNNFLSNQPRMPNINSNNLGGMSNINSNNLGGLSNVNSNNLGGLSNVNSNNLGGGVPNTSYLYGATNLSAFTSTNVPKGAGMNSDNVVKHPDDISGKRVRVWFIEGYYEGLVKSCNLNTRECLIDFDDDTSSVQLLKKEDETEDPEHEDRWGLVEEPPKFIHMSRESLKNSGGLGYFDSSIWRLIISRVMTASDLILLAKSSRGLCVLVYTDDIAWKRCYANHFKTPFDYLSDIQTHFLLPKLARSMGQMTSLWKTRYIHRYKKGKPAAVSENHIILPGHGFVAAYDRRMHNNRKVVTFVLIGITGIPVYLKTEVGEFGTHTFHFRVSAFSYRTNKWKVLYEITPNYNTGANQKFRYPLYLTVARLLTAARFSKTEKSPDMPEVDRIGWHLQPFIEQVSGASQQVLSVNTFFHTPRNDSDDETYKFFGELDSRF